MSESLAEVMRRRSDAAECPSCGHHLGEHDEEDTGCLVGWGEVGKTGCACPGY